MASATDLLLLLLLLSSLLSSLLIDEEKIDWCFYRVLSQVPMCTDPLLISGGCQNSVSFVQVLVFIRVLVLQPQFTNDAISYRSLVVCVCMYVLLLLLSYSVPVVLSVLCTRLHPIARHDLFIIAFLSFVRSFVRSFVCCVSALHSCCPVPLLVCSSLSLSLSLRLPLCLHLTN